MSGANYFMPAAANGGYTPKGTNIDAMLGQSLPSKQQQQPQAGGSYRERERAAQEAAAAAAANQTIDNQAGANKRNAERKVIVPVRFKWSPGHAPKPQVNPLAAVLKEAGHSGENVVITNIRAVNSHSTASDVLHLSLTDLAPSEKTAAGSVSHGLATPTITTDGKRIHAIVPPGFHARDEVLYNNALPSNTKVNLASHATVDPAKIRDGVIELGDASGDSTQATHVMVTDLKSPTLFPMIADNLSQFASASHGSAGNAKTITIANSELDAFLSDYKGRVQSNITRTPIADHSVSLSTWGNTDHFGKDVAESASLAHERDQQLAADTQHTATVSLEYTYLPHDA